MSAPNEGYCMQCGKGLEVTVVYCSPFCYQAWVAGSPPVVGEGAVVPSSQGPCTCPDDGVSHDCPRHAYMWDYVGQSPLKDHLRPPDRGFGVGMSR